MSFRDLERFPGRIGDPLSHPEAPYAHPETRFLRGCVFPDSLAVTVASTRRYSIIADQIVSNDGEIGVPKGTLETIRERWKREGDFVTSWAVDTHEAIAVQVVSMR